jgi:hypothetical protein
MAIISVTPDDITATLDQIGPGTEVVLKPGRYREVLRLAGKQGSVDAPIVLRGKPGAVITDETSAEEFRRKGNEFAKKVEDGRVPPPQVPGPLSMDARRPPEAGALPGRQHFNDAIRVIQPDDKMFDETPHSFGNFSVPRDRRGSVGERFVTTWHEHGIDWYNDVVA